MKLFASSMNSNWLKFLPVTGFLALVIVGVTIAAILMSSGFHSEQCRARLIYFREARPLEYVQLLAISEQLGYLLEASAAVPRSSDKPMGPLTVRAISLNNLAPAWEIELFDRGTRIDNLASAISPDGSSLAIVVFMYEKWPKWPDYHPDKCQSIFLDLRKGKVEWVWPEKPLETKIDFPFGFPRGLCFANAQEAYWLSREQDELRKQAIYRLDISKREAHLFLKEGEEPFEPVCSRLAIGGYCASTEELLVCHRNYLYGVSVKSNRRWRVLFDDLAEGLAPVHVANKGQVIALDNTRRAVLLRAPPEFASRVVIPRQGSVISCSPDGRYVLSTQFIKAGSPHQLEIFSLSGSVAKFSSEPLNVLLPPVIWFDGGKKIAASAPSRGWAIWELEGLNQP
ncbi:MAG: hypothetical protein QXS54_07215 [Candidatus Methanomethylicaceae archaeon]